MFNERVRSELEHMLQIEFSQKWRVYVRNPEFIECCWLGNKNPEFTMTWDSTLNTYKINALDTGITVLKRVVETLNSMLIVA